MRSVHGSILALTALLASCGGSGGSGSAPPPSQGPSPPPVYTLSGTVTGLTGTLVLRVNDATDVSVNANGAVALAAALGNGASYSVVVKKQPSNPTQLCELANASGTIASANVSNVAVSCAAVPLTLASSTPAKDAMGVARDAPLTLTFSTTLDAAAATVTLTGPAGDVASTVQVSGAQLVVTPTQKLARLGAYTLSVSGLKGSGGELLATSVSVGFQSADGAWSTPVVLDPEFGDSYYPRIAMDANGNALALWVRTNVLTSTVVAKHWSAGAGWDDVQSIETNQGPFARMPEVRFDRDGNALAVWVQYDENNVYSTYANRFDASGSWNTARHLGSGKRDNLVPTIAFDESGGGFVLFEDASPAKSVFVAYQYAPPMSFTGTPVPVQTRSMHVPQACFDSAGRAQVVWAQGDAPVNEVRANAFWGGSFTLTSVLDAGEGDVDSLRIVCPSTGGARAVWVAPNAGVVHVYNAELTPDGWTGAGRLDNSSLGAGTVSPSTDAAGNTILVWSQRESGGSQLWSRRAPAGAGWLPAKRIDDPAPGDATDPELALNASGEGWAVWRIAQTGKPGQIAAAHVKDGEFSNSQIVDPDAVGTASTPRVAIDADGNAIAVWRKCSSTCKAMASRFE